MKYMNEQDYLKNYDASQFDRPSVTADILIFSVSNQEGENWRRANKKTFSVLLVKRDDYPQIGKWNLPGGFIQMNETTLDTAHRVLRRETGVSDDIYMEQLYTFDAIDRDPRTRVLAVAYMALVDKTKLHYAEERTAQWFNISYVNGHLILESENGEKLTSSDLAFDHAEIIRTGIERLRNKVEYTDVVFSMMPDEFTLGELQQVFEVILDKKLLAAAFRRTVADRVVESGNIQTGFGHRPSALFRYKK